MAFHVSSVSAAIMVAILVIGFSAGYLFSAQVKLTVATTTTTTNMISPFQTNVILSGKNISTAPSSAPIVVATFYAQSAGLLSFNLSSDCPEYLCTFLISYQGEGLSPVVQSTPVPGGQYPTFFTIPMPSEVTLSFLDPASTKMNVEATISVEYQWMSILEPGS
jgi:hypothetical protein